MKQNKFAYLLAAALAAGTVGISSCSSDVADITEGGVENKVTLSLSIADRVAGRATADQVNLGSTFQAIKNIAVVPMICTYSSNPKEQTDSVYLSPIILGDFTPTTDNKTHTKVAALNSNVNKFKVYGNINQVDGTAETHAFDESKVFINFMISAKEYSGEDDKPSLKGATFYKPHGLYYYAMVGREGNQIKKGSDANSVNTDVTVGEAIGKDAKYIKLSKVNYAVGVLATAVFNASDAKVIATSSSTEAAVSSDNVKFKGIIINKQTKTLNQDFAAVTEIKNQPIKPVSVYDAALNTASGNQGFDGSKFQDITDGEYKNISKTNENQTKANIYTIVTSTGDANNVGEIVTGNLEFELQQGYKLKLSNGQNIDATNGAKKFYMAFRLNPQTGDSPKAVFMKDYMTFFNAKVKNWGLASETPIEVTDATISVEVDLEWNEGIVYDQEI